MLDNAAFRGALLCDVYISQVTQRDCVTVMQGVTSGSSLLGYIAADFHRIRGSIRCATTRALRHSSRSTAAEPERAGRRQIANAGSVSRLIVAA
jgi:hypothetical protein